MAEFLVQLGDNMWVRLDRVEGVRVSMDHTLIFVIGDKVPYTSNWDIVKVLEALEKGGPPLFVPMTPTIGEEA